MIGTSLWQPDDRSSVRKVIVGSDDCEELQMTGYTVHTGSSDKFAAAWDRVFQGDAVSSSDGATSNGSKKKNGTVQAKKGEAAKARRRTKGQTKRG